MLLSNLNHEEIILLALKQRETSHLQGGKLSWPPSSPRGCSVPEVKRVMSEKIRENDKGTKRGHIWPNYCESQRQKEDIQKYSTGTQHPWALPEKRLSWNPVIESINADNAAGKWVLHSTTTYSEAMSAKFKGWSVTHDSYSQPNCQLHISATKEDF